MRNTFLKELRKQKNEKQIEVANLLGLKTGSAYSKKENGQIPVSLKEAVILSEHFQKPLEEFITELIS